MATQDIIQRLAQKHDPRLVNMLTSGIDARPRPASPAPDMWAQNLGLGAEADFATDPTQEDMVSAANLSRSGMTRAPGGAITNVNRTGEQVLGPATGMPERYDSGGSFQTFSAGLGRTEAEPLPGDIRSNLLVTAQRPEDMERELKALQGREQSLLRSRYIGKEVDEELAEVRKKMSEARKAKDLLEDQRREQQVLRNRIQDYEERGVGDRDALIRDYNEAAARAGMPYEKRVELARKEAEAIPAAVPFGDTEAGVRFEEGQKALREQIKGRFDLNEKLLDRMDRGTLDAEDYGKLWTAVSEKYDDPMKMIQDPETGEMRLPSYQEKQALIGAEVNQILNAYQQRYGFGGGGGVGLGSQTGGGPPPVPSPADDMDLTTDEGVQARVNQIATIRPDLSDEEIKGIAMKEHRSALGRQSEARQPEQEKESKPKKKKAPAAGLGATPEQEEPLSAYEKAYPAEGRGIGPAMDFLEPKARALKGALGGGGFLGGAVSSDPAEVARRVSQEHGEELASEFWRRWEERRINRTFDAPPVEEEIRDILADMGIFA